MDYKTILDTANAIKEKLDNMKNKQRNYQKSLTITNKRTGGKGMAGFKLKVTPEMESLTQVCVENSKMDPSLYGKYDVKRGLRDVNGKGVLAGLTQISSIHSTEEVDGKTVPCEGRLCYRGYDIRELTQGFLKEQRFGFEEVTYLLLFG